MYLEPSRTSTTYWLTFKNRQLYFLWELSSEVNIGKFRELCTRFPSSTGSPEGFSQHFNISAQAESGFYNNLVLQLKTVDVHAVKENSRIPVLLSASDARFEAVEKWNSRLKGRISKRVFQENKEREIFQKTNISYPPDAHTYVCVSRGKG